MVNFNESKKLNKFLLFIPPAFTSKNNIDINPALPLGNGYLASVLLGLGKEVKIVDCLLEGWNTRTHTSKDVIRIGLTFDQIKQIIIDYNPDVVGVNSQFTRQYENAHNIYRIAKEVNPDIITIAGGAHPTVAPDLVMEDKNVDYIIMGEGEECLKKFVLTYESNPAQIPLIDGIAYRNNSESVINPKKSYICDLDLIPFPAWDVMNIRKYFGLKMSHGMRMDNNFCPIITSRGCPANCVFCSAKQVWGRKYRARSPENVLKEIEFLKEEYDVQEILIEDDNFTFDTKRAETICDMIIERDLGLKFDTPNGIAAYKLDNSLLAKMKEAGFYKVNFAIESGNQEVLTKKIKKPLKLEKVEKLIYYCRELNFNFGVFFIVGVPETTLSEMWDNYKFCKKMKIFDPFISIATPYPGSELYKICKDKGYLSKDFSLDNLFIKTYNIQTKEWGKYRLLLLMKIGYIYLKIHQLLDDPRDFSKQFYAYILNKN